MYVLLSNFRIPLVQVFLNNLQYITGWTGSSGPVLMASKVRGFKLPIESSEIFFELCVCTILSKHCSYTHEILNFVQENVKNCTPISHFCFSFLGTSSPDSLLRLCSWTHLWDFRLPDCLAQSPTPTKFRVRLWMATCHSYGNCQNSTRHKIQTLNRLQ